MLTAEAHASRAALQASAASLEVIAPLVYVMAPLDYVWYVPLALQFLEPPQYGCYCPRHSFTQYCFFHGCSAAHTTPDCVRCYDPSA